jgi:hypothetical protein
MSLVALGSSIFTLCSIYGFVDSSMAWDSSRVVSLVRFTNRCSLLAVVCSYSVRCRLPGCWAYLERATTGSKCK